MADESGSSNAQRRIRAALLALILLTRLQLDERAHTQIRQRILARVRAQEVTL